VVEGGGGGALERLLWSLMVREVKAKAVGSAIIQKYAKRSLACSAIGVSCYWQHEVACLKLENLKQGKLLIPGLPHCPPPRYFGIDTPIAYASSYLASCLDRRLRELKSG
jgi:hypothetical protein